MQSHHDVLLCLLEHGEKSMDDGNVTVIGPIGSYNIHILKSYAQNLKNMTLFGSGIFTEVRKLK